MSPDWLKHLAGEHANRPALISAHESQTFSVLADQARGLAEKLSSAGVGPGDRVACLLPNSVFYVQLIHALIQLGAVLVPLNTRLVAKELSTLLGDADPQLLVTSGPFESRAREAADSGLAVLDEAALRSLPGKRLSQRPLDANKDQALLFTSGTTGQAKGVRLSLANHLASAAAGAERLSVQAGDRWLLCVPLYHVAGIAIVLRCALFGMSVVLHERFSPESLLDSLEVDRIQAISLVPTMLERLLDIASPRIVAPHLRFVLLGGGAASSELLRRGLDAGLPLAPTYGLTEAASQVATLRPREVRKHLGSVGRPLLGVSLRILDEQGRKQRPEQPGEIHVRGPQIMHGYWRREDASAETLRDGWLRTGDIGKLSRDGFLTLLDRPSDLIVSGGENVYPAEVEKVLTQHPEVQEAAVVAGSDSQWGHRVHAFLVSKHKSLDMLHLMEHCRTNLAAYKIPRHVHVVSELPRSESGKLLRAALRERVETGE